MLTSLRNLLSRTGEVNGNSSLRKTPVRYSARTNILKNIWVLTLNIEEAYKAAKVDSSDDAKNGGQATVEDEEVDEDGEAGPELPPDFDQEDVPDDEEGRFFGGGITGNTAAAMDYIEKQEDQDTAVRRDCYEPCLLSRADWFSPRKSISPGCGDFLSISRRRYLKMRNYGRNSRTIHRSMFSGKYSITLGVFQL